ncbi:MAG: hypothetical protein O9284_17060 [Steroidobacteraceae bacterium]|nr:hypothetical protein [Steroidobacteraceae bacterium]
MSGSILPDGVRAALVLVSALVPAAAALAQALPYLPAGDVRLRHEVQLAVDAGRMPLGSTWPIPTRDVPEQERDRLRSQVQPGSAQDAGWFANGALEPTMLRGYADTPRENAEVGAHAGWAAGDYAGGALRLSYAADPEDGRAFRYDDSYLAWRFGNWWATVGAQQRWWGPGHEGSLILSSNARPMLQVSLDRAEARAPEWTWLKWVGPYRWTTFMGALESDHSGFPNPLVWGLRLSFRPFDGGLEVGLSRTAQWCRPGVCDLNAFGNVLLANDNRGESVADEEEPGNQLAGADIRYRLPIEFPLAAYWQFNGESIDNGNYRPRQLTQLIGFETWSRSTETGGSWRAFVEYAGTACGDIGFSGDETTFGCAYENGVFTDGYRYRGRVIGHSAERDARLYALGGLYADSHGRTWEIRLRGGELNRGATAALSPSNTIAPLATDLWSAEARLTGALAGLRYRFGIGIDRMGAVGSYTDVSARAFVSISAPW